MPNNEAVNYEIALICAEAQEDFVKEVAESLLQFGVSKNSLHFPPIHESDGLEVNMRESYLSVFSQAHLMVLFVSKEFIGEEMRKMNSGEHIAALDVGGRRYVLPIFVDNIFPSFVPDKSNETRSRFLNPTDMAERINSIYEMTKAMDPETERYCFNQRISTGYMQSMIEGGDEKNIFREHYSAKASYLSALSALPEIVSAYCIRGDIKCLLGQHRSAIRDYNRAINLELSKVRLNLSLAGTCQQLDDQYEEEDKFRKAVLSPEPVIGYYYCAITESRRKSGLYEKSSYEQLLTIESEMARILFSQLIGRTQSDRVAVKEIIWCFRKAVRQHQNDPGLLYFSGLTKALFRRYDEAIDDFDEAIRHVRYDSGGAYLF